MASLEGKEERMFLGEIHLAGMSSQNSSQPGDSGGRDDDEDEDDYYH